jgi:hypothetical protein
MTVKIHYYSVISVVSVISVLYPDPQISDDIFGFCDAKKDFICREIPPGPPTSGSGMRGLPGPQVPPRNAPADGTNSGSGSSSDRLLSVSGKKKCSHCKEELGTY